MCIGAPGRIVEIGTRHPDLASVEVGGRVREINIGLIVQDGPRPGDWVDVHLGMAVAVLDEEEARQTLELLRGLEEGEPAEW